MESDTGDDSASGGLSRLPDHALGWELHADAGADTFRARNDNRAAVQLDQTFGQRQTEARTLVFLGDRVFHLLKRFERYGDLVVRHAYARIRNRDAE